MAPNTSAASLAARPSQDTSNSSCSRAGRGRLRAVWILSAIEPAAEATTITSSSLSSHVPRKVSIRSVSAPTTVFMLP